MNFSSAVEQLVQAHMREISYLQGRITILSNARAWNHDNDDDYAPLRQTAESHRAPLDSSRIAGVSRNKLLDKSHVLICTPKMSASGNHCEAKVSPHLPQVSSFPRMIGDDEGTSHADSEVASVLVLTEQGCNEPQEALDMDMHHSVSESFVMRRWHILAEGVLIQRAAPDFCIHPGWQVEDSFQAVRSKSASKDRLSVRLSERQKSALGLEMAKAKSSSHQIVPSKGGFAFLRRSSQRMRSRTSSGFFGPAVILHPASPQRRIWVFCLTIAIFYEIFIVTMAPFDVMNWQSADALEWLALAIWTSDIILNFFTGSYIGGKTEMRFYFIAKQYIRTWFAFDVVVVGAQFVELLLVPSTQGSIFVLVRIVRIIRVVRVARIFSWLKDELGVSNYTLSGGKLVQFLIALFAFVHCSACLLYEVGKAEDGWISEYQHRLDSASHDYLVSLHWALSQLQGNVDIYPGKSTSGCFFVVLSSWCSIIALTLFVSSMTDTLFDVRQQEKRRIDTERLLRDFFGRHDIDPEIRARAEHFHELQEKEQTSLKDHERDEQALKMFPPQLRSLLRAEMLTNTLVWHPVFSYLRNLHRSLFVKVCSTAVEFHVFEPNDDVFTTGDLASCAHYICKGDLVLSASVNVLQTLTPWLLKADSVAPGQNSMDEASPHGSDVDKRLVGKKSTDGEGSPNGSDVDRHASSMTSEEFRFARMEHKPVRRVNQGQLVSEVALWMSWVHVGDLCSTNHSQCFFMKTRELIAALGQHPNSFAIFSSYAERFVFAARAYAATQNADRYIELMDFRTVLEIEGDAK